MSWGEKAEIKEELLEEFAEQRATNLANARRNSEDAAGFDSRKKIYDADLATRTTVFETKQSVAAEIESIKDSTKSYDDTLTEKKRQVAEAQLAIDKADVEYRESQMDKLLSEKDRACKAQIEVAVINADIQSASKNLILQGQVQVAEANATAKDAIIESQKGEIERLDELLKVTMGKLTQVDLKGVTIHVEAAKPAGKDNTAQEKKN